MSEGGEISLPASLGAIEVEGHVFKVPKKEILEQGDMGRWLGSSGANQLMDFIMTLNQAVAQKKVSDYPIGGIQSAGVLGALKILDEMAQWTKEIPPQQQAQRFGNKAFRTWFERLQERGPGLMRELLPANQHGAIGEIGAYLEESVGNSTRIDYGTGHELAFVAWLCALFRLRLFSPCDLPLLVFHVFRRYLEVVRGLQQAYMMEPAGSHGVWGLDDFQFIPFLWGSAQFIDHPFVKPKALLSPDMVESLSSDYLFMAAIAFIREMKKGPFAEHSPMLYDISSVGLWTKVNMGLHKMYVAEVLAKFPVVQHFLFGSLFSLHPAPLLNPFIQAFLTK